MKRIISCMSILIILLSLGLYFSGLFTKAEDFENLSETQRSARLHLAAQTDDLRTLRSLLSLGVDADSPNPSGLTPLDTAVEANSVQAARLLIQSGANVNAENMSDETYPVYTKVTPVNLVHSAEILEVLLSHGARFPRSSARLLWNRAIVTENMDLYEAVVQADYSVSSSSNLNEGLYAALYYSSLPIKEKGLVVQYLVTRGANINAPLLYADSLLHFAAWDTRLEMLNLLIQTRDQTKADLNVQNGKKRTPFFCAVLNEQPQAALALLRAGARTDIEDINKQTPILWAKRHRRDDWVKIIESGGKYKLAPKSKPSVEQSERKAGTRIVLASRDGLELAFRWIPPGTFVMGAPESDPDAGPGETRHQVTLTQGFWMLETEVTQYMWYRILNNPKPGPGQGSLPVQGVDWYDCRRFCQSLANWSGFAITLPTEAQWEYACRAGKQDSDSLSANKSAKPHRWGLQNMFGGVSEWCADACTDLRSDAHAKRTIDPIVEYGLNRVIRGACTGSPKRFYRPSNRNALLPELGCIGIGLRVCLVPTPESPTIPKSPSGSGASIFVEIPTKEDRQLKEANSQNLSTGQMYKDRQTLCDAVETDDLARARYLISMGWDVQGKASGIKQYGGLPAIHFVRSRAMLELLLQAGADINQQSVIGYTALHEAVRRNESKTVQALLQAGASVNLSSNDGWTPLHIAAQQNRIEIIKALIDNGADVNVRIADKRTPLHVSALSNNIQDKAEAFRLLIQAGADVDAQDKSGQTPLQYVSRLERRSAAANESIDVLLKSLNQPKESPK